MALDHRRLIRPGKKTGRGFCVRQVYFTKSCQQIWLRVNQPFIPVHFIHHLSGETILRGTVFIIQTTDRMQSFTICNTNCTYSIYIQEDRSMRRLFAKRLKKFQNHLYGQPVLSFAVRDVGQCLNEH